MSQLWEETKTLFFKLNELPKSEHEAFIQQHTAHNPELNALLLNLLSGDAQNTDPLGASQLVSEHAKVLLEESYLAQKGQLFANYEIIETLGEGGMGIVYLAKRANAQFQQKVAIKVIHSNHLSQDVIERFRQERKILASLQHPNIAQLIDGGETETGLPYIVMEYVNGTNIIEYCQFHKLSIKQRLSLFQQVLKAVDYAHQRLIIHRDLKPSNVLVTEQGNVKLLDFGIAKLLDSNNLIEDPHLTKLEVKVLTPLNASPEQVRSEQATTRTDIYGLCTLLYQMLTERPLFETNNVTGAEIESWILDRMPSKPSDNISDSHSTNDFKLASTLSGDLDTIILKGLQKEPERRYSSVEQLASDIHRYQKCFPIKAKPDSNWYIAKKFLQRNRTVSIISAVFIVLLFGFMTALIHQTQATIQQRDIALRESNNSKLVSEFLKQTFNAASPYVSGDKKLTPKDLVDNAKKRLVTADIEPVLLGQLQVTIADVYLSLSEFDLADELILQARKNYQKTEALPEILAIELEEVAIKHAYFLGDLEKSLDMLAPVLKRLEGVLANWQNNSHNDKERMSFQNIYIDLLLNKAGALGDLNEEKQSLEYAEKALQLAQQLGNNRSSPMGEIYALLGHIHRRLLNYEASEKMLLLAADEARELYGDFNLELAYTYNQLASTYSRMERLEEGLAAAKKGYTIRNELYPNGHAEVGASLGMLSNLSRKLKQYESAIDYRLQLSRMLEKLFGTSHYYVALNAYSLAELYLLTKEFENAKQQIRFGETVVSAELPQGNIMYARGPLIRGKVLYKENKYDAAIGKLTEALLLSESAAPQGHSFTGEARAYLALCYNALQQAKTAAQQKVKALDLYEKLHGINSATYVRMAELLTEIE